MATIEELKKLIDVLERKGKASASALINFSDDSSLETKLFQLIKNENHLDEDILIDKLYGRSDKFAAYKMLKSRVKRKLYNQLFFLDLDSTKITNELGINELKCARLIHFATVLRKLQEVTIAEQQLKKAINLAQEAHLVKCEIDALLQMRILYAELNFNRKNYDDCVIRLNKLYAIQEFEKKADEIYYDIRFDFKIGVEAYHKFSDKLSEVIIELEKYWNDSGSNYVFRRYHQLKMMLYELSGDFTAYIVYLKEVFSLYDQSRIHPLYFDTNFNKFLLVFACLRAKQYTEGIVEAEELKGKIETSSHNWFAHMENYFLLTVHSKDYQRAEKLISEVLGNKYFAEILTFAQERWLLYLKFLNYISGYNYSTNIDRKLKHVKQDKKGYNVWNLILDFILILDKGEPELIEREIDRLRKFIVKYLGADEDARTKLFLKLLQVAGREYPDTKACRRKGNYLFNKLQQSPVAGIAYAETEIIPYEHLWELILGKIPK